jgi:hypothetical protein
MDVRAAGLLFSVSLALAGALVAAPVLGPRLARADGPPTCESFEAEYALAANLKLADTFMGAGDGVFPTGPGKIVLRWSHPDPDRLAVEMVSYELHMPFTLSSSALLWSAKVISNTTGRASAEGRGVVAAGTLHDRTIRWDTPLSNYHVDGTIQCDGSLCGRFGAPAAGVNEVHIPARSIPWKPFELAPDRKTFSMDYAVISHADSPKQTTLISLAGREMRRTCLGAKAGE